MSKVHENKHKQRSHSVGHKSKGPANIDANKAFDDSVFAPKTKHKREQEENISVPNLGKTFGIKHSKYDDIDADEDDLALKNKNTDVDDTDDVDDDVDDADDVDADVDNNDKADEDADNDSQNSDAEVEIPTNTLMKTPTSNPKSQKSSNPQSSSAQSSTVSPSTLSLFTIVNEEVTQVPKKGNGKRSRKQTMTVETELKKAQTECVQLQNEWIGMKKQLIDIKSVEERIQVKEVQIAGLEQVLKNKALGLAKIKTKFERK